MEKKYEYITFWGDTVDYKQLLIGMGAGALVGLLGSYYGNIYVKANFSHLDKSLVAGYALLIGILSALLIAIIAAKLFKPKRVFNEQEYHCDKDTFIELYQVDLKKEAECLQLASPELVKEMKDLQLYSLFAGNDQQGGNKS